MKWERDLQTNHLLLMLCYCVGDWDWLQKVAGWDYWWCKMWLFEFWDRDMSWHRVSFIAASWMCRGKEPPASFKVESGLCKTPSLLVTLISLEPGSRKTTNVTASSKESHFPAIPVFASSQKHATKLDHGLVIVSCYVDHCRREK